MKKYFLMALVMLGVTVGANAQDKELVNRHFKVGYTANVELSATDVTMFHITSSHGYSFGHGLYLGGGAGFGAEWGAEGVEGTPHYVPSLFLNARWSALNDTVSPFVDVKALQYIDLAEGAARYGVSPTVGLDMGRFSLGIGYAIRFERENAMQVSVGFVF